MVLGLVIINLLDEYPVTSTIVILVVLTGGTFAAVQRKRRRDLEAQQIAQIEFARSQEINRYHAMSPVEFEQALAYLCQRDGCTQAQVVGRAGDLGADVIAFTATGQKVVLQAKRYGPTTKVTGPDLQRFGGTCFNVHRAAVAAVVTTSVFTKQAREYAGHMGIHLVDANALAAWASRTGPAPWH